MIFAIGSMLHGCEIQGDHGGTLCKKTAAAAQLSTMMSHLGEAAMGSLPMEATFQRRNVFRLAP
jgi:hypothetical protein